MYELVPYHHLKNHELQLLQQKWTSSHQHPNKTEQLA